MKILKVKRYLNRDGGVGNKRVDSVTNVELRKSDNKHYFNDTQSESPYKRRMKREGETLTTEIMYLPRVLPNGTQGGTRLLSEIAIAGGGHG
jgi:hypothetical protein